MKCMNINKQKFWYALFKEKIPKEDEYGNETGEYKIVRENPKSCSGNISAAKGETSTRQFGESEDYDKVIVVDNNAPKIDEYTVLWIDSEPQTDEDGSLSVDEDGNVLTPHDYIVKRVARSINSTSIAISKVKVS